MQNDFRDKIDVCIDINKVKYCNMILKQAKQLMVWMESEIG